MDFNSNDEYLKAFPPNFGPKLEGCNMLNPLTVSDFQVQNVLPKNQQDNIEETNMKQMPEAACLSEELECVEVQEPIQVPEPVYNVESKGDNMLKAHELLTLSKEDLREKSNFSQPEITSEPMLQVVDMIPVMEVQRDNEMVLGESDGEPSVEAALSLQAPEETRVFVDGETLVSDTQVEGPASAIEILQETTIHCEMIPAEDAISIGVIKDSILALENIGQFESENSVLEEDIERVATMKDETSVGLKSPWREFVEGTQIFVEQERPLSMITDIDTVEAGNTMDITEQPLQDVQNGQPDETLIEFVEDTVTTRIEISEDTDAIEPIETTQEPVTLEIIKTTTTITATYETQTSQNELTEHTQIEESEVLETEDAATMAVEITEKTTVKAKAVCLFEGEEEPPFAIARNGVPSASNSTGTGLEGLGTCSDADVDKIVDSIMNDIADIEADMEVENEDAEEENEADMESNTRQQQKLEICGKSAEICGMESSAICQDYIQSPGSHV